ncbi:unnamed protein product [Lactuca virosa]|uniref:Uncharacterized protein n=1 Tax=Lactuca virosa TaxID=75947 RepID=A0AAU9MDA7_9ASTR|nr:unnamed protein product [Lactuca virosa]
MRTMIERLKMEVFNLCEIVFIIMSPTFTGIGRNDPSSESARVGSSSKKNNQVFQVTKHFTTTAAILRCIRLLLSPSSHLLLELMCVSLWYIKSTKNPLLRVVISYRFTLGNPFLSRQHHQSPPLTRLFCSFGYDREVEYVYGGSKGLEEESLSLQFTFSVTKKLNFLDCIGNPRRGFLIKKLQWILLSILNAESKRVIYWWRKEYMMLCRRNISRH